MLTFFIQIESLYPEEMEPGLMTVEDFLNRGILLLDKDIQERVEKASLNGKVLRYVCVIEGSRLFLFVFPSSFFLHILFIHASIDVMNVLLALARSFLSF